MGARHDRRVVRKRRATGAIREDRLSRLTFEVLFEINKNLPFKDCHSLQVTNRINATVSRAHLDRVFMTVKDVRHRIPKHKYPFVKGSYPRLREDGEGGLYEEATTLQYAIYHENHLRVAQTSFILFSPFLDLGPVSAASDSQRWIYGGSEIRISNSKTPV
jgi:hypothetical protein